MSSAYYDVNAKEQTSRELVRNGCRRLHRDRLALPARQRGDALRHCSAWAGWRVHHAHSCRLHVRFASLLLAHCPGDGDLRPVCHARGEISHHTTRGLVQVVAWPLYCKLGTVMREVHAFNAEVDEHDGANDCYRVLVR